MTLRLLSLSSLRVFFWRGTARFSHQYRKSGKNGMSFIVFLKSKIERNSRAVQNEDVEQFIKGGYARVREVRT